MSASTNGDLHQIGVAALSQLIEKGEVSPVEVVQAHLDRIAKFDGRLRALISVDESAIEAATTAERELHDGHRRGPLHGIPLAHKDNIDVCGIATTAGSRVHGARIAKNDATVVRRLRNGGAIALAKANLLEYASGDHGIYGHTRNPRVGTATPGGSSSGSGAAVAAGLVPAATGTDTGSSVRNPAAYCGLVGLRPTHGLIPVEGVTPLSWSQDTVGPLARSVEDAALLFAGMTGEVLSAPDPSAPVRFALPQSFFFEALDPELGAAINAAGDAFARIGGVQVDLDLPEAEFAPAASWTIAYSEAFAYHERQFATNAHDYTRPFYTKIVAAGLLSARDYILAQRVRSRLTRGFAAAFEKVDILVVPTTRGLATSRFAPSAGDDQPLRWNDDFASVARPASLLGLPAMSVPLGLAADGSPLAVQLIGRPNSEATLFRAAEQLELVFGRLPAVDAVDAGDPAEPAFRPTTTQLRNGIGGIDAEWVLREAQLRGLDYVTEEDALVMAPLVSTAKCQLETAMRDLDLGDVPILVGDSGVRQYARSFR